MSSTPAPCETAGEADEARRPPRGPAWLCRLREAASLAPEELRWAAGVAAVLMALTCLPYLFGAWLRPGDFMGHVYNTDDANVHLAWMRQAAEGRWLFTDRFTSEAQQPQFTHFLFLVLGRIAGWLGGSYGALIGVYHAARVLFGWLLLVATYVLASYIYPSVPTRRLALLAAGLSSGLGWLTTLLGRGDLAHDYGSGLVMPEAVTFLSIYIFPLFAASMLALVAAYLLFLRALDTGRVATALAAGGVALVLGHIHSYDILPLYAVLAAYVGAIGVARRRVPWREAGLALVVVLVSVPAPLYQYFIFRDNPIFQQKALTPTLSPPLLHYASTFGLVLVAAAAGAFSLRREPNRRGGFLIVWAVVTIAMTYAPVSFQRKMIEGAHLPLAILAAAGWMALRGRIRVPLAVWMALFLVLTVPSNAAHLALSVRRLMNNNAELVAEFQQPFFLNADERAALDWLKAHAGPEDVVLSTPHLGGYLPAWAGATTYVSHWAETIDYQSRKLREMGAFYQASTADAWRIGFLRAQRIRYVFWSDYERGFAEPRPFDPARAPYLKPVFARERMTIFEVAWR